jgi:hypothetical protein
MFVAKPKGYGACPTFFVALCLEASEEGDEGFWYVGRKLAQALGSFIPYELEEPKWVRELEKLNKQILRSDQSEVRKWLNRHIPRCMALIPESHLKAFLDGIDHYVRVDGNRVEY